VSPGESGDSSDVADHPRRKGELSVDYLYGQVVPSLIKIGEALLLSKTGKKEIYAFRVES
jgi:hypothetical protein